ncbi:MAG: PH domain-containing protein [Sphingomonadales bacterium]|nr:PH domain-containing protein [Sphingomonadales bacterium]
MTADLAPPEIIPESSLSTDLQPVEPGYRHVLRIQFALTCLPIAIAVTIADAALLGPASIHWLPTVAAWLLALLVIVVVPARKYRHVGYRLAPRTIRIVRGFMFHVDTVVPFVRVQHIDVARGPVERLFGVASLVIHTAGTHNSIVTLPGLSPDRAAEIRDDIRRHIGSDS